MAVLTSSTLGKHYADVTGLTTEEVVVPGVAVSDPAALTAPTTLNAVFAVAEVQALRNDVAALRTKLIALLDSLRNADLLA